MQKVAGIATRCHQAQRLMASARIQTVNAMAAIGKLAFESIVQAKAPDANRARAFTRYETRNQLAWVAAGLLAVIITPSDQVGFVLVGVASGLAAAYYLYSS